MAWAEENSRDSIFEAFQRRETYATSGTRPIVRFYGGFDLPPDMCRRGDFARQGYDHGVPMGGTLATAKGKTPSFAVSALMDPDWVGHPGATLQRAQIVKGWVDEEGEVHERVYDVAGGSTIAPVDLGTCAPAGLEAGGQPQLCSVWKDPDFDPKQHAFYYARVLENPSCRWNQYYCLDRVVDCTKRPAADNDVVGYDAYEYQQCCSNEVPKAVQQRAWTARLADPFPLAARANASTRVDVARRFGAGFADVRGGEPALTVPERAGAARVFGTYLGLGFEHILGIELGQLLFVGVLLVAGAGWKALRRAVPAPETLGWRLAAGLPAYVIGTLAAFWTFERIGGLF